MQCSSAYDPMEAINKEESLVEEIPIPLDREYKGNSAMMKVMMTIMPGWKIGKIKCDGATKGGDDAIVLSTQQRD